MFVNLDYQEYVIEGHNGVSIEVCSLESSHYQKVMQFMDKQGLLGGDAKNAAKVFVDPEIKNMLSEIIPAYSRNLKGIKIKEKGGSEKEADKKDLVK